ncbi:fluoride efflux transporter CrcB [Rossellomorea sp. SC111]|uniref:fluoride efflux transporter CrcB n=1 Tax=Rossellomorea sp. SC111 TaxID=2968985 RepID=UPI00215ADBF4|nr:fluoride efflux transporter CrcB [Rossellomorea sp. SC111]MCR8850358.1 fluoride efflux transporter CrcB [Rossellomorea sp. SC111]
MIYILVGAAGMVGALLRYYLGIFAGGWWDYTFPMGTFLANMIGSFTLGYVTTYIFQMKKIHSMAATAIGTGMIGSFTTFSTFSVETVDLLTHSHLFLALIYVLGSVFGGLFLSWAGFRLGKLQFDLYKRKGV